MWRPEEPRPCCSAHSSSAHRHALLLLPSGWEGERVRTPAPLHVTRTVYSPHHGRYIPIWTIFICQVAISGVNFLDLRRARLYPFKPRSRASRLGSRSCAHIGFLLFESFPSSVGKSSAAFSLLDAAPCVVIWRATGERRSAQRLSRRSE